MRTHYKWLSDAYFEDVKSGVKSFETRKDDCGYQKGDIIEFAPLSARNYDCQKAEDVGDWNRITKKISYILTGGQWGIQPGYIVMALTNVKEKKS